MNAFRSLRASSPADVVATFLLAGLALLLIVPLATMFMSALLPGGNLDTSVWAQTLTDRSFLRAARNTAILAVVSTVISVPIGVLFAWLIERTDARMGTVSRILPVIPMMLPPIALSIGWLFLADPRAGFLPAILSWMAGLVGIEMTSSPFAIQSWGGLIFLYILYNVPHVYVICAAAFISLDPSLEEAARIAGRGRFRAFMEISFPAIRFAVGSSALLCVMSTIGLYSIPALLGTTARIDVLSVYIYRLIHAAYPPQLAEAAVVSVVLIIVVALVWLIQRRLAERTGHAQLGGMGVRPNQIRLDGWKWPARAAVLGYIALTSVVPLIALGLVALMPYWQPRVDFSQLTFTNILQFTNSPQARLAIFNSATLAVCSTIGVMAIAALAAIYGKEWGGNRLKLVALVTKMPAPVPNVILAVGILVTFGFWPFYMNGTWIILFVCYTLVFIPTASIAAESAVQQVGNQLVEASRISGAGRGRTLRAIQLPLLLPGLAAGGAMIFTIVVGELNAAAILSGPKNAVVGYLILNVYDSGTYSDLAAIGTIIGIFSAVIVSASLVYSRPRFSR